MTNLSLFKDNLRPEHLRQIAKQGFVVVPAHWKQMEFVYELNNYPEEHRPSFVTTDSMLHTFHIFYDTCCVPSRSQRCTTSSPHLPRAPAGNCRPVPGG